jgi:hypothetical protein
LDDDPTAFPSVLVPGTVEIREDIRAELARFRALREKHGISIPADEEFLKDLADEGRVLLAISPDKPLSEWTVIGLD